MNAKHVVPGPEPAKEITLRHVVPGTCEAGGRIKPGAQAPGMFDKLGGGARETGDSAAARFAGSGPDFFAGCPGACAPGFILPPASQAKS